MDGRTLAAAAFGLAGGAKLFGVDELVAMFDQIGFGQWFRYLTGILEVTGAVLMLIPALSKLGNFLLLCIAVGAIATHAFLIGGNAIPAIGLLLLTGALLNGSRHNRKLVSR